MRARCSLLLLLLLIACSSVVQAGPRVTCPEPDPDPARNEQQARALFEQALREEPSDPDRALEALRCAEGLAVRASIALRIGTIAERVGRLAEAADAFERYLERAGSHAPDAEPMRERIRALRARVDAKEPPSVGEAAASPNPQQTVGWVTAATGLASTIVGVALLGAAKAHADAVHELEPGTTAWSSEDAKGTFEQAELEQKLGIVGLVVGSALLGLGAVLVATGNGDDEAGAEVRWLVTTTWHGAAASLRVRF